jgi:hypothetical protein
LLNGRNVGRGNRWESLQEYDVTRQLRAGRNVIDVHAVNIGDSAGLIAELSGDGVRVGTDATWLCAKIETASAGDWVAARVVSNYPDSLWTSHKQGPPKPDTVAETPAVADSTHPAPKPAPLEMRWFRDKSVLPFDTRSHVAQPAGWYRFRAAPGLRGMTVPAPGNVQAWVDGKEVRGQRLKAGGPVRFELPEPAKRAPAVALRIEQQRGCYGGAALPEPVTQDCATGMIEAGDWSLIDGLNCYSGGARYRKTVALTPEQTRGGVTLDLGKVVSSAEVRVNGRLAGVRIAPPWRVDISKQVKPGPNRIEVLVFNTLANHYLTIPTRYRGELTSGLLGPVTLDLTASK